MSYDVRFLKGTRVNYDALPLKDVNTFYYVDEKDLYLGEILLSSADEVAAAVGRISLNEQAIKNIQAELDALVDPEGTGGGSITSQLAALRAELAAMINANADDIAAEASRAKSVESGLRTDVDKVAEDLVSLQGTVEANEEDIEKKISDLNSSVATNTSDLSALKTGDVEIRARLGEVETAVDTLGDDIDVVETAIAALVGADAEKSVRQIANEELAAALIPEEAIESLDTLQEIAAWIQGHPDDVAAINASIQALEGKDTAIEEDIISLEEAIAAINNTESGILAQAKVYTNAEILKVSGSQEELESAVSDLEEAIAAIHHEDTGILAKAEEAILEAIQDLGLGTAAYEDIDYFEKAGAAAAALNEAKAYTNEALTWGVIPAQSAE